MEEITKVEFLNPEEYICGLFKFEGFEGNKFRLGHITHDKSINEDYDYQIIRELSHDGTLLFTQRVIGETLETLVNKRTYCTKDIDEEQAGKLVDIEYLVGDIRLESEYSGSRLKNKVYIPVRCKYTFNN